MTPQQSRTDANTRDEIISLREKFLNFQDSVAGEFELTDKKLETVKSKFEAECCTFTKRINEAEKELIRRQGIGDANHKDIENLLKDLEKLRTDMNTKAIEVNTRVNEIKTDMNTKVNEIKEQNWKTITIAVAISGIFASLLTYIITHLG